MNHSAANTPEPDLAALRALEMIANTGSISAASAKLGVSQQAVSLRLSKLESTIGAQLVTRSHSGSHLTATGELIAGWAAPLISAGNTFAASISSLQEKRGNTLSVASSLTIAEYLVPNWVSVLRTTLGQNAPKIRLTAMNSAAVSHAVREGDADIGFIETPELPRKLSHVQIASDTIEVVTSPDHEWATRSSIALGELAATPLILREAGSGTRQALEYAFENAGLSPTAQPAAVVSTTLAVRSAIMAGTAPGAISSLAIADDIQAGRLSRIKLEGAPIIRPLTTIWAGKTLTPSAEQLLNCIAQTS